MDHETRMPLTPALEERLGDRTEEHLALADAWLVSDYGKGVLTPRLARRVIEGAARRRVPVIVDPKGTDYTKYRAATLIKPNVAEVERLLKEELDDLGDIERAGRRLAGLLEGTAVLITRGPAGMTLVRADAPTWHVSAAARQVYDVTGAGDTVVAAVALALAAGAPLEVAIRFANRAAGAAVARRGTAAVTASEVAAV